MNRYSVVLVVLCICGHTTASLTAAEKQEVLDAHNTHRNTVSPGASDMLKLEWDDELAAKAQGYADKCPDKHNVGNLGKTARFIWIGENMAYFSGNSQLKDVVSWWDDEKQVYNHGTNICTPSTTNPMLRVCGHYTQVVWADTKYVGCGFVKGCTADARPPNRLVCNYGDTGNWPGKKPYKSGAKCSACPAGYSKCEGNLCARG